MKWSASVLATALTVSSLTASINAFSVITNRRGGVQPHKSNQLNWVVASSSSPSILLSRSSTVASSSSSLKMSTSTPFTVGIVGATGAVGKEIRTCLEARDFPVKTLRIFGSERSAGTTVETEKYGSIVVELFDVQAARQCDVVFLAVSGDFSLEHARALSEGSDGCVVIDNSVRNCYCLVCDH